MINSRTCGRTLAALGVAAGMLVLAWTPAAGGGVQPTPGVVAGSSNDVAQQSLRDLLSRKLEETRLTERRLRDAIARLDAGANVENVRSIVRDVITRPEAAPSIAQNAVRSTTYRAPCDAVSEDEQRILQEVLDTVSPDLLNRMEKICTVDQQQCDQHYLDLRDRLQPIIRQGMSDETMFRLRLEEIEISRQVFFKAKEIVRLEASNSPGAADRVDELRGELSELIGRQYDLRMTSKQYELLDMLNKRDQIGKHISSVEASILEQAKSRDDVISQQVDLAIRRVGGTARDAGG